MRYIASASHLRTRGLSPLLADVLTCVLTFVTAAIAGWKADLINQICDHILDWNQQGITFLVIEHNMDVIMSLCDRVWVLAEGRNLASGTPTEVQQNPAVLAAYLGQD